MLAMLFSLLSFTVVYGAEKETGAKPEYVTITTVAEDPEALYGEYIPVLMYHHFAECDMKSGNGMVVETEALEDHLRYFKSQGYQIITLEKLDALLRKAENTHTLTGKGLGLQKK